MCIFHICNSFLIVTVQTNGTIYFVFALPPLPAGGAFLDDVGAATGSSPAFFLWILTNLAAFFFSSSRSVTSNILSAEMSYSGEGQWRHRDRTPLSSGMSTSGRPNLTLTLLSRFITPVMAASIVSSENAGIPASDLTTASASTPS